MNKTDLIELKHRLRQFADARDWDQFDVQGCTNVAGGRMPGVTQWLTEEESAQLNGDRLKEVRHELADIQIYLVRIADKLNIDLLAAVDEKIQINEAKYPAEKVKGQHKKYTEYTD